MINKETIVSVYNEKLTLLQWLKSVNKALDEAVLTNVEIQQRGNATFVFVFTFEDGTQVESNEIIVNQGESINGASIVDGHLILSLTNGDELDAGNIKPVSSFGFNASRHLIVYYGDGTNQDLGLIKGVSGFSINASQHLIVTYDNGTTEDLGAIFDGNISIDGNISASGTITGALVTGDEIRERMGSFYRFDIGDVFENYNREYLYAGVVKNGNKITFCLYVKLTRTASGNGYNVLGYFQVPEAVHDKLIPATGSYLEMKEVYAGVNYNTGLNIPLLITKESNNKIKFVLYNTSSLTIDTDYFIRCEVTFLLSDSLVS